MADRLGGQWVDGEFVVKGSVYDDRTEQQEFVDAVYDTLKDEVPLEGEDSGWVMIGGIKLGTTIVIKSDDGAALFELSLRARPGVTQDFDPNGIYPVLLKRGEDGSVERISVNFTSPMEYSNQLSPEQTQQTIQNLVKLGMLRPK